jgi:hypothetical protein
LDVLTVMARRKSEARRATKLVGVRFTPDEYAWLAEVAEANGKSVPEMLRLGFTWLQIAEARAMTEGAIHG